MATGLLAVLGGVLALVGQLLAEYYREAPERKRKAHDLAQIERNDTQAAMAAVDRQLDGVPADQRPPILLSPDDRV